MASSSSNFQLIFDSALKVYQKRTRNDLLSHPLATQLQACDSPIAILALLHQQVQELNQSRSSDGKLSKWLEPTVDVLYAFSTALGEGAGLVFSPAKVICVGVGVLLLAAKNARDSQDALGDIFQRMEGFFRRLEIYIEVPATRDMIDMITQIMVEVLSILGIATKELKESRTKKYMKKLLGTTDLEDALKRLDKLTHEEAQMATAQVLKVTHTVDRGVMGITDNMTGINDRVAYVDKRLGDLDDRVAGVGEGVIRVDNRMIGIDDRVRRVDAGMAIVDDGVRSVNEMVAVVIDDGNEAKQVMQQVKQNQLREKTHKWLSPPDPSTNHNIACATHHKGTATWFLEGNIFQQWKTRGSLLWIHGKPGSGKSILCSAIIKDIAAMCEVGQASMAYFYFDFRNDNKQHLPDLIRSLLIQLSAHSDHRRETLLRLYGALDNGEMQPSDLGLLKCLREMFTHPDPCPTFLIMDALDECPDTSGIPSPREQVLRLVKELVELYLPNLHICVTSRPEVDIRDALESLTPFRVSLHDERGQKDDIVDYVKSVVCSDSERIMRRWKAEDKDLVIETLSKRADGMFRWVFCQLQVLRHCLPPSVRHTLAELPDSLDETYERVLKEIKKPNRDHAHRILQCLVVAIRPLRVEELAEIFAVDFDSEGVAKLNPSWRWEDEEQALLSSCSSLISVVDSGDSRVVLFSHFSVKEFLTSSRLATSSQDLSRYHIALEHAHTILVQACFSILLRTDDPAKDGVWKPSPLTGYAAQHWVTHAKFENISSFLRRAMESLFDLEKPHFAAWHKLHDIDQYPVSGATFYIFCPLEKLVAAPLYYSALCGFHDLTEHLIGKYPQQVNALGGYYVTPLVAALAGEHFGVAELLLRHGAGATVNVRGDESRIPLHSAVYYGQVQVVRFLIEHNADVNSQDSAGWTLLYYPFADSDSGKGPNAPQMLADVARLLLQHGAEANARDNDGWTPLHVAAWCRNVEVARVLLEHGANVDERDNEGRTAFQFALEEKRKEGQWKEGKSDEFIKLLSEYGARTHL